MNYGYTKDTNLLFHEAISKIKEILASEGFGVLTEIDVKATMKAKIGAEYENYTILGACNPNFAHKALQAEKEIGLLLPCNVIVYEDNGTVFVSSILPTVAMAMIKNTDLSLFAKEVENHLKRAIDAL